MNSRAGNNVIRRDVVSSTAEDIAANDAVPRHIAEDEVTERTSKAELDQRIEVTRPGGALRDTVEMEPVVIDALCIASRKKADDIERATTETRRRRRR